MTKHTQPAHTNQREWEWEKEFDFKFVAVKEYRGRNKPAILRNEFAKEINLPDKVKQFIRNLLQTHDATLLARIEEMKYKHCDCHVNCEQKPGHSTDCDCLEHNEALDQAIALIQEGDNEK